MKEKIAIVLGSKNDMPKLKEGIDLLDDLKIAYCLEIISAHRNPEKLRRFCLSLKRRGIETIIAAAGMAAALPGFIASYTDIPVIGVALEGGLLGGIDALFSITSTPKGLGLVASGVGKSAFINAVIFSLEILALGDKKYAVKLRALKKKFK
ncbi:MAG: 5-(carboxyamino)imidazole ribonucleotide mutase [Candidatus Omnitrophica bacterium]|nr:5-(carboxyamino)imidazole ribonucleotide mutase [Candidatus Omnitrophota bacterium]MDD5429822.1 5-(carboxyamino)imidazole ribonucleotide mutase [Candidatus Omnitrophota bacterium]